MPHTCVGNKQRTSEHAVCFSHLQMEVRLTGVDYRHGETIGDFCNHLAAIVGNRHATPRIGSLEFFRVDSISIFLIASQTSSLADESYYKQFKALSKQAVVGAIGIGCVG